MSVPDLHTLPVDEHGFAILGEIQSAASSAAHSRIDAGQPPAAAADTSTRDSASGEQACRGLAYTAQPPSDGREESTAISQLHARAETAALDEQVVPPDDSCPTTCDATTQPSLDHLPEDLARSLMAACASIQAEFAAAQPASGAPPDASDARR